MKQNEQDTICDAEIFAISYVQSREFWALLTSLSAYATAAAAAAACLHRIHPSLTAFR